MATNKIEFDPVLAFELMRLSKMVYKQEFKIDWMPEVQIFKIDDATSDTQSIVVFDQSNQTCYVVFRGSESSKDWINNLKLRQKVVPYNDSNTKVRVHRGFIEAYKSVREKIQNKVKELNPDKIYVAGHSLGGALATLCGLDLEFNHLYKVGNKPVVYTFGAPKIGNMEFVKSYNRRVVSSFRIVNERDVVAMIPRFWMNYWHVNKLIRIGEDMPFWFFGANSEDHSFNKYLTSLQNIIDKQKL